MNNFCEKCGSMLDAQTGQCPQCGAAQTSQAGQPKRSGRPVKWTVIVVLLLAGIAAIAGFLAYSDIAGPAALRHHEWSEATCTEPKTCTRCGQTDGAPLGHSLGAWVETVDILHASRHLERSCTVCGTVLNADDQAMTSFVEDGSFAFTPEQLWERLVPFLQDTAPDAEKLTLSGPADDAAQDDLLLYSVFYDSTEIATFYCYDRTDHIIKVSGKSDEPVWSVSFCVPLNWSDSFAAALNMFDSMIAACDPLPDGNEREAFTLRLDDWFAGCLPYGWSSSTQAKNGIIYRMDITDIDDDSDYCVYGSAYATADLSDLNLSGAAVYDRSQDAPADTPNYTAAEAENLLIGNWKSKYLLVEYGGETYKLDAENSTEDRITMTFREDHRAELNIEAFSLDSMFTSSLRDFWNGRDIQWDYLFDSGDSLYYLVDTPYMSTSDIYSYDPDSSASGLLRVTLSEGVSVLLEKQ